MISEADSEKGNNQGGKDEPRGSARLKSKLRRNPNNTRRIKNKPRNTKGEIREKNPEKEELSLKG